MSSVHWMDSRKSSRGEHAIQEAPRNTHVDLSKQRGGDEGEDRVKGKWDLSSNAVGHKFKLWVPMQKQYVKPHWSTTGAWGRFSADILPYSLNTHTCLWGPRGFRILRVWFLGPRVPASAGFHPFQRLTPFTGTSSKCMIKSSKQTLKAKKEKRMVTLQKAGRSDGSFHLNNLSN